MANTQALILSSASQQYLYRASTSSLQITGDLTLEAYLKPTSLPSLGSTMSIIGKWDESGVLRSYLMDLIPIASAFGDGSDGSLTISSNTTEAPIDSTAIGTSGTSTLTATNGSFAANQADLIIQMRGTGAGTWMKTKTKSYTAGTITIQDGDTLNFSYNTSGNDAAQVRVLKQYSSVTINSGVTYTAKAWDGSVGGILAFLCNGTTTVTGSIVATSTGFRGGLASTSKDNSFGSTGTQGEGTSGDNSTKSFSANGSGGGAGTHNNSATGSAGSGAGGGNGGSGVNGTGGAQGSAGTQGGTSGSANLTSMTPGGGGGGGGGGFNYPSDQGGNGALGGGVILISSSTLIITGSIVSNGAVGSNASGDGGDGGSGAGGSILLKALTATLGTTLITATGGAASTGSRPGGAGGTGRIHLDYATSYSGSTFPTLDVTQDSSLSTNTIYQLRLQISSTGSNSESYVKTISISASSCIHVAISWLAGSSLATFYVNGVNQGTITGSFTAIHSNNSQFFLGANKNSVGSIVNYLDSQIDDMRVWSMQRNDSQISVNYQRELAGNETNLVFYGKLNGNYNDSTANANNLSVSGSPAFTSNVCFSDNTTTSTSTTTTSTSTTTTSTSTTRTTTSTTTSTSTSSSTSTSTTRTTTSTSTTTTSTSTTMTTTSKTTTSTSSSTSTSTSTSTTTTIDLRLVIEKAF